TPFGVYLVGGFGVLVVILAPVPTMFRDFTDGVDLLKDVLPVLLQILRFWHSASHTNDRHVTRLLMLGDRVGEQARLIDLRKSIRSFDRNFSMEFRHGARRMT